MALLSSSWLMQSKNDAEQEQILFQQGKIQNINCKNKFCFNKENNHSSQKSMKHKCYGGKKIQFSTTEPHRNIITSEILLAFFHRVVAEEYMTAYKILKTFTQIVHVCSFTRHTSTGFRYEDTVNFLTYSGTFLRQNPLSLNEKHNASPVLLFAGFLFFYFKV